MDHHGHTLGHNHGTGDHGHHRKTGLAYVIFFNAVITAAEYIGGMMSGSLALISDAGHNPSDALSPMLGYAGEKVSESDPNKRYSFGLKRFEVLIALVNALSLVIIGIYILYEAVRRFMDPVPIDLKIMLPVAVIGLLGNIFSMMVLMKNRNKNINMKAAFLHLLYDAVSSAAVIAAGLIIYATGLIWVDIAISFIIVAMIIRSSAGIISESFRIFLQGTPRHIDPDDVLNSIRGIDAIGSVHGLHIWSINSTEVFLSCHICVDKTGEQPETDRIIIDVNAMLKEKYNIVHTTIQVEMVNICAPGGRPCRG